MERKQARSKKPFENWTQNDKLILLPTTKVKSNRYLIGVAYLHKAVVDE
jgi:hypothetical protein